MPVIVYTLCPHSRSTKNVSEALEIADRTTTAVLVERSPEQIQTWTNTDEHNKEFKTYSCNRLTQIRVYMDRKNNIYCTACWIYSRALQYRNKYRRKHQAYGLLVQIYQCRESGRLLSSIKQGFSVRIPFWQKYTPGRNAQKRSENSEDPGAVITA